MIYQFWTKVERPTSKNLGRSLKEQIRISNHPFSRCELLVSGRVVIMFEKLETVLFHSSSSNPLPNEIPLFEFTGNAPFYTPKNNSFHDGFNRLIVSFLGEPINQTPKNHVQSNSVLRGIEFGILEGRIMNPMIENKSTISMLLRNPRRICKGLDIQTQGCADFKPRQVAPNWLPDRNTNLIKNPDRSLDFLVRPLDASKDQQVTWVSIGVMVFKCFVNTQLTMGFQGKEFQFTTYPPWILTMPPWNLAIPKKDGVSSSNQQFSRAFAVSFREGNYTLELDE